MLAGGGVERRAEGPARRMRVCVCMVAGGGGGAAESKGSTLSYPAKEIERQESWPPSAPPW